MYELYKSLNRFYSYSLWLKYFFLENGSVYAVIKCKMHHCFHWWKCRRFYDSGFLILCNKQNKTTWGKVRSWFLTKPSHTGTQTEMLLWLILKIGKHEFLRNCEIALVFSRLVSSNALAMFITRTRSLGNWAVVHEDRAGLYKLHPNHCPSLCARRWQTIRTGAAVGFRTECFIWKVH